MVGEKKQIKYLELSYELCRFSFMGSLYTSSGLIHVIQYYLYQLFINMIASSYKKRVRNIFKFVIILGDLFEAGSRGLSLL